MSARFYVYGEATWTTQTARDQALTRLLDAAVQYNTKNGTNVVVQYTLPTNTSISVVIDTGENNNLSVEMFAGAYASWTQTGRFSYGWMSFNRVNPWL